ncbi:serine/threonine-protein kinase [Streptomyces sp. SAJ15]|uniref:serine/threonine-protein kinase n=1 Tax=Streptomyces sp. SAJ15 TaxID=2011095 RepID=UPI001186AE11|nr:serine/threonine-protein kinase [Streptomyces sp. SAJ15]TVL89788.1 serine/threonine protein kinase [Streptomyces sp. SAJ15]
MSGDEERLLAGRYLLVEQLGHGGMGTVWRAQDQVLGREVAVKELTVSGLPPEELAVLHTRMEREARAAARVKHPGVVTVFDVLEEDGRPWIVMELIDGQSLADVIATEGTLLPRDAARLGAQLLSALDRAHQLGVLHRDIKPANVLLERGGRVVLTDFGIAVMGGSSGLTRTGDVIGSPDYLAPERAMGHRPGPESDLWSLGVTLYAAVEGQSPFRRTTTMSTLHAVVADELPEPRHAGPLAPVIEALLRKDPNQRPSAELAQRMLSDVASGPAQQPPTQVAPPPDGTDKERLTWEPTQTTPPTPALSHGLDDRAEPARGAHDEPRATPPTARGPSVDHDDRQGDADDGRRRRHNTPLIAGAALAVVLAIIAGLAWALASKNDSEPSTFPPTTRPNTSLIETASPEASPDAEMTKVWISTFKDGPIRRSPSRNSERIGTLNAGRHYVFCRTQGATVTENGVYNSWWLWIELNEGGKKGWVSAYYINGNDRAEAEDGTDIPDCKNVAPGGAPTGN